MLYETIDLQSTYSSCVSCFLFLCVFNLLNFMILRNGKVHDAIFKSFQNKQVKFLSKKFCRKWEGETFPKWLFIFKQFGKCQNEYCPYNSYLVRFCRRSLFPYNTFVCHICSRGIFYSRIYRDGIKNVFNNSWRMIRMAKKHSNNNF